MVLWGSFLHLPCYEPLQRFIVLAAFPHFLEDSSICFLVHLFPLVGAKLGHDLNFQVHSLSRVPVQKSLKSTVTLLLQPHLCLHLDTSWNCCFSDIFNSTVPVSHLHQIWPSSCPRPSPSLLLFLMSLKPPGTWALFFSPSSLAPFCKQFNLESPTVL